MKLRDEAGRREGTNSDSSGLVWLVCWMGLDWTRANWGLANLAAASPNRESPDCSLGCTSGDETIGFERTSIASLWRDERLGRRPVSFDSAYTFTCKAVGPWQHFAIITMHFNSTFYHVLIIELSVLLGRNGGCHPLQDGVG